MDDAQKAVYQGRLASIKEADSKADLRDELYWPLNSSRFGWESSAIDVWIEDSFLGAAGSTPTGGRGYEAVNGGS